LVRGHLPRPNSDFNRKIIYPNVGKF
jgi:hypothetical protein